MQDREPNPMMRLFQTFLHIMVSVSMPLFAAELSEEDFLVIERDITRMFESYETGDPTAIVELSYESLVLFSGGKEEYKEIVANELAEYKLAFSSIKVMRPDDVFETEVGLFCIVPVITSVIADDRTIYNLGYTLAMQDDDDPWQYMAVSDVKQTKAVIEQFYPVLSNRVQVPVSTTWSTEN